jgi:uncharacterized protein YjiS (DUF1127 family)
MSALTQSRRSERPALLGALIERLAGWAVRQVRAVSQRQALRELARLDDRMLKDIGLYRGDLEAAECLPRGSDPIVLLRSRRAARNNARFANRYF